MVQDMEDVVNISLNDRAPKLVSTSEITEDFPREQNYGSSPQPSFWPEPPAPRGTRGVESRVSPDRPHFPVPSQEF